MKPRKHLWRVTLATPARVVDLWILTARKDARSAVTEAGRTALFRKVEKHHRGTECINAVWEGTIDNP